MHKHIDFKFQQPEENMGYLIWQTTMRWQRQMNRALAEIGLTNTQFVILMAVAWQERQLAVVTQADIADHSNLDRMMVSKILRHLEKENYIARQTHPTDTRAKSVALTDAGATLLQEAIHIKNEANEVFFAGITDREAFAEQLRQLLA